jgi:hypothetical protein
MIGITPEDIDPEINDTSFDAVYPGAHFLTA